jgi:hypothetical protein
MAMVLTNWGARGTQYRTGAPWNKAPAGQFSMEIFVLETVPLTLPSLGSYLPMPWSIAMPQPNGDPRPGRPSSDEIRRTTKPITPPGPNVQKPEREVQERS